MEKLIAWLVAGMLSWTLPSAQHDANRPRYEGIARDAVSVAADPSEPPLFEGADGRIRTAALILAIASMESTFAADVEEGRRRGDDGGSWCLMQLHLNGGRIALRGDTMAWTTLRSGDGWSGPELVDRRKCFRAGLHVVRESMRRCKDLSGYTAGPCTPDEPLARHRMTRAKALLRTRPQPWSDEALVPVVKLERGTGT